MKRLITVEEHYGSEAVNAKIRKIFEEHGTEEEKKMIQRAIGTAGAPGATDLGAERIAYMDAHGIAFIIFLLKNEIYKLGNFSSRYNSS